MADGLAAWAAVALAAMGASGTQAAEPSPLPTRVISINLCTDQLAMALANPGQLIAVSRLARYPELSYLASQATGLRPINSGAEDVLGLKPDMVLASAFSASQTRATLMRHGVRVEAFVPVNSVAEARTEVVRAAALLGVEARGAELVVEIDRKLAAARNVGQGLTAIAYERRGFAHGKGTLLDDLMTQLGLVNLAARAGLESVASMPLETVVAAHPDVLILDWGTAGPPDQGTAMLQHPALTRAIAANHRIWLPAALAGCAGPALPVAVELLSSRVREIRQVLRR
jgi:iron complex transport system substrate-binding protein